MLKIAIDGYVCSGKSTIAKALAERLGIDVFDTGAVYRAIACEFKNMGFSESDLNEEFIKNFVKKIEVIVKFHNGKQKVLVNGKDYSKYLRLEDISLLTAKISRYVPIREKVLVIQRKFAQENSVVMEGRDIGSEVLLDADFKFFCTADENVRAMRRFEQQKALGNTVSFEQVLQDLRDRDYKDIHREHGAIKKMPDSIVIDTTNQTLEESVEFCLKYVNAKSK